MTTALADAVQRLSRKIVAGEVVFFIGAGFSLESEGNDAWKLVARLLIRFEALTSYLTSQQLVFQHPVGEKATNEKIAVIKSRVEDLQDALQRTFDPSLSAGGSNFVTKPNAQALAKHYYQLNDWICNAFSILLLIIEELGDYERLASYVEQWETERLRDDLADVGRAPISPTEFRHILELPDRDKQGKALFLDTLGFDNKSMMRGNPQLKIDEVVASYRNAANEDTLRPRHHVIAWMAREGFCPVVLTTNYDLLLEGAYRQAGFDFLVPSEVDVMQQRQTGVKDPQLAALPKTAFPQFARVARDVHYFNAGGVQQTALIYKIHGCVETYRQNKNATDDWNRYLDAMVFTYREIQNWRNDSWSRDLLNTVLRTQTVAFSGYSAADPVVHDTFRTIYEEMAQRRFEAADNRKPELNAGAEVDCGGDDEDRDPTIALTGADDDPVMQRQGGAPDRRTSSPARNAPAFFMDVHGQQAFHGLEVLRAASRAVGDSLPVLGKHDNLLAFHIAPQATAAAPGFPTLDEMMQWLFHSTLRKRQAQLLDMHLWSTSHQVWNRGSAKIDYDNIVSAFRQIRTAEMLVADRWGDGRADDRTEFERTVGWTLHFHRLFMREYAIAEAVARADTSNRDFPNALRRWPWYFPCSDRPQAAVWCIILEIAIRRMAGVTGGHAGNWWDPRFGALPQAESPSGDGDPSEMVPTVQFLPGPGRRTPQYLIVRTEIGPKPTRRSRREVVWPLSPTSLPWHAMGAAADSDDDSRGPDNVPFASDLWRWAAAGDPFDADTPLKRNLPRFLQVPAHVLDLDKP